MALECTATKIYVQSTGCRHVVTTCTANCSLHSWCWTQLQAHNHPDPQLFLFIYIHCIIFVHIIIMMIIIILLQYVKTFLFVITVYWQMTKNSVSYYIMGPSGTSAGMDPTWHIRACWPPPLLLLLQRVAVAIAADGVVLWRWWPDQGQTSTLYSCCVWGVSRKEAQDPQYVHAAAVQYKRQHF